VRHFCIVTTLLAMLAKNTRSEEAQPDKEKEARQLARESQNPVSSLIAVPFHFDSSGGIGPFQRTQYLFSLEPVVPIPLKGAWTLVPRLIMPFVGQPEIAQPKGSTWGAGDFNPQIYVAVTLSRGFTLALGPTIVHPHRHRPAARIRQALARSVGGAGLDRRLDGRGPLGQQRLVGRRRLGTR
jgi:hypothetical protein